ncbi:MAG: ATPase [Tannerellaceae bacterium]|nr:ATPase [Tannerellaceae bacterium]
MILIADGGSTKVDWRLLENGKQIAQLYSCGMNPYFRSREEIKEELIQLFCGLKPEQAPEAIFFYGAGCTHEEVNNSISRALSEIWPCQQIEIRSDLWAAARGLCGSEKGIACILGTGSNSCFYDGLEITDTVSPLGYILGDEGSGAVLGKLFIGACLKNGLTSGIKEEFLATYELTPAMILEKVYRQPLPNRFLASISPFILSHLQDASVRELVTCAFREFFRKNVFHYKYTEYPIHFTGSVAFYYQEIIREVALTLGVVLGSIEASPMDGLIRFHS